MRIYITRSKSAYNTTRRVIVRADDAKLTGRMPIRSRACVPLYLYRITYSKIASSFPFEQTGICAKVTCDMFCYHHLISILLHRPFLKNTYFLGQCAYAQYFCRPILKLTLTGVKMFLSFYFRQVWIGLDRHNKNQLN